MKNGIIIFEKSLPWFVYLVVLLAYPLVWPRFLGLRYGYFSELVLFTPPSIVLLCLCIILLNPDKAISYLSGKRVWLFPGIPLILILIVCSWHLLFQKVYLADYFWTSLIWIALPLLVAIYYRLFESSFVWFMAVLGIIVLLQSCREAYYTRFIWGICGNWNWNASLIAITVPFVALALWQVAARWRYLRIFIACLIVFLIALSLYLIWRSDSKGTWIAILLSLALMGGVRIKNKISKRMILWLLTAVFVIFVLGMVVFNNNIAAFLLRDIRIPLWTSALELIKDNLLTGTGPSLFESKIASYIPEEHYLNYFANNRHPHPHNHFLFIFASLGIIAGTAWCVLLFFPLWKIFKENSLAVNWRLNLLVYAFLILFFHSMFDVILYNWPCLYIGLIILGILWGRTTACSDCPAIPGRKIIYYSSWLAGTLFAFGFFADAYRNVESTRLYRKALQCKDVKKYEDAVKLLKQSTDIKPSPQNIYLAALISFYDLKRSQDTIQLLEELEKQTGFINYVNNNGIMARALVVSGRPLEAVQYFEREKIIYPLGSVNLYFYWQTLKMLGASQQAEKIHEELLRSLELKGVGLWAIPLLIRNPRLDIHFREIKDHIKFPDKAR